MRRWALSSVMLFGLAACASGGEVAGELNMALSCQLKPCICAAQDATLFFARETSPVRWRQNGDAYCDAGFRLEFGEDDKKRRR